ncbi:16S rRNA (adenine(1518)-N(6)/adenine(1519)-N(6))-dimethyltransferase RsmA [Spirochaeta cellobiosiphila]|uniref:16S rRNA (adenine(1518)-N(6)/adenine(1519)-N(6))- dimethyltransferase RsmA n=1 Tax=Spirochaeta cellobiosiphila TaxID=504483 RepID=UPI000429A9FC|nr:16S rRNA (adenine(1518)-N(6)/adenine(1519)-N(6))-dimethyltransferase RsmA [Spirochaeta cellobiosiphila]
MFDHLNYDSPNDIKDLLQSFGFNPRKKWGQNFLINPQARIRIVEALQLERDMSVWEVGPGLGAITHHLLDVSSHLTVFEIDPGYIALLQKWFGDIEGFSIVEGDVIKTWKSVRAEKGEAARVVGNLPYNAASSIISSFIDAQYYPEVLVITVQKEMAERMIAKPGNKNYSSFSILCQSTFDVKLTGDLKPGSFFPRPEVVSSIAQMKPHGHIEDIINKDQFFKLVRELFSSKRKTLKNNILGSPLANSLGRERVLDAFSDMGIDIKLRPETISVEQYIGVSNKLQNK